jgi:hypothetical protein
MSFAQEASLPLDLPMASVDISGLVHRLNLLGWLRVAVDGFSLSDVLYLLVF